MNDKLPYDGPFTRWFEVPCTSTREKMLTAFVFAVAIAVALVLTKITMFKWGDPITDLGAEFVVAGKLAQGQVLYRDLTYSYGPFSPYFNSLLLRAFGNEMSSVLIGSALSVLVGGLLVFRLLRNFAPPYLAASGIIVFLLESVFGHYYLNGTFGFIFPYAFPAVHSLLLGMAAVDAAVRSVKSSRPGLLIWSGLLAGLVVLCKLEIAAATIIAVSAGLLALGRNDPSRPPVLQTLSTFLLPVIAIATLGFLPFMLWTSPNEVISQNILKPSMANPVENIFQFANLGFDQPLENLGAALKSLGYWLLFPGIAWAGVRILRFTEADSGLALVFWGLLGFVPAGLFAWLGIQKLGAFGVLKGLPLILIIVLGLIGHGSVKRRRVEPLELVFGIVTLFACVCLSRIMLNVGMFHYGFFMAMPGLVILPICLSFATFFVFPSTRTSTVHVRTLAFAVVLALSVGSFRAYSLPAWQMKEARIEGPGGLLKAIPTALNQYLGAGMEYMDGVMDKDGSLVVIPEGAMLNVLFRRENPTRYCSYTPHVVAGIEPQVAEDFRKARPDYVLLVDRKVDEFGKAGPGKDYLLELMGHLHTAYDTLAAAGPVPYTSDQGGWVLFQRK